MAQEKHLTKDDVGYFQNTRSEMLKYIPADALKILEVGCGEGNFCRQLKRDDREIWGVEINENAAEKAGLICDQVFSGDIDILSEKLPSAYFDCIIFNDVLEHLYTPWKTLGNIKKLLSPKGVVVCSIPNFRYVANIITEIILKKDFQYKPAGGILDDTHIRFFTSKSIIRMFHEQGYDIITHEGVHTCKSWKEKLVIKLSFGILSDSKFKEFATVAKPGK
jgi:2-polyprenyl-3-methyl-5-hydroxy-6-metoxy-1,4-benzoquinol methylase